MSINVSVGFQIPTNVVEVGDEISTQQLGAITSGSSPTSANPFTTVSYISGLSYLTTSSASTTYAPKASPTFTGVVTIPAGASISGYLTTATASSTYQTLSGMTSYLTTSTASSTYQTISGMTSYLTTATASSTYQPLGSYLTDAPSDGSEYVRKNAAWAVVTGGGGSVTNIDLTGNFNGYSMGSGNYTFKFDSTANTLRMQDGSGSGITISPTGITFPNSSVLLSGTKSVYLITGAFTLALSDANNIIYADSSAGGGMSYTISIPEDSTTNFPVGTVITFVANAGSGATADFASAGMGSPTIYGTTSYGGGAVHQAFLTKVAANTWIIK